MSSDTPTVTLNNGQKMPLLGLGTWQSKSDEVKTAVRTALDAGYRHIDTAFNYLNEEAIGEVLSEYIDANKVKRDDLYITTKLGSIHTRPSDVEYSMNESLKKLRLEYVDMFLLHTPFVLKKTGDPNDIFPIRKDGKLDTDGRVDMEGVWKEMERMVDQGKTKGIGISNFNCTQIERIHKIARIMPATNQVECHAYLSQIEFEKSMKRYCIQITAYSPIGSPGKPSIKHLDQKENPVLIKDPVIGELARKYDKTPAQILLRSLIQRNLVVIPKSITPSRIKENANIFDVHLTQDDMERIIGLDRGLRYFDVETMRDHPDYPFGTQV